MPVCDPVSRSDLLTNYQLMPDAVVGNLRTIIIGPDYSARNYNSATLAGLVGPYDETTGVIAAWPDLQASETVDLTTATVTVINGLINYYADTGAPPVATEGAQNGTIPNEIVHNSGTTIFAGTNFTPALNNAVAVGDYVKLDDTLGVTLETRVAAFDYTGGNATILVLEDNLPAGIAANFNIILAEISATELLPSADVTLSATQVQADASITIATTRTGTARPLIAGQTFDGTDYSDVYTSYRALVSTGTNINTVNRVSAEADLDTYFTGWDDPDSGLGFAVARALAPVSDGVEPDILFIAVASDDTTGWTTALAQIQPRNDWMTVVPITTTAAIQSLVTGVIVTRNTLDIKSRGFYALELTTETVLVSGAGNTVEVDQSLTPGTDRTVTRDGGIADPFTAAQIGDIVQIAAVDYVIESVVSAQTVTIVTAASSGAGQVLNNVRHPLTTTEQVNDFGGRAQALASEAISVAFPPDPTWNGTAVGGYHLAAASAGLRGYTMPHQSLTGAQLEDNWGVPQSSAEFFPFITTLANYGCFVYEQCELLTLPNAIVSAANTTDQTDFETGKESIVANKDGIVRYITSALSAFVGRAKVTVNTLSALRAAATDAIEFLRTNTFVDPFGAILVSGTVGRPIQDSNSLDTVIVPITIVISAGLEVLTIQITITIEVVS